MSLTIGDNDSLDDVSEYDEEMYPQVATPSLTTEERPSSCPLT